VDDAECFLEVVDLLPHLRLVPAQDLEPLDLVPGARHHQLRVAADLGERHPRGAHRGAHLQPLHLFSGEHAPPGGVAPHGREDLRAKYDDQLWIARLDVTDSGQVRSVVNDAFKEIGEIDVVVNNAGYGVFASVEEATDEQIRRVSTVGGQATYPSFSYYHASKWGIEGFCETAAKEIAPFGTGLTIVEPGATPTGFRSALDTAPPMPEYAGTPADDVRRAVAHGRAALVTRLAEHDAHRDIAFSVVRVEPN
jgi:NAD(P)-dependent dehydrogenase (short-subunit alcohol dehydrogenase family)